MKRLIFIAALCALVSTSAMADMARVTMTQGPGVGNGGAFTAEITSGAISYGDVYLGPGSKFLTFCVELTEYFTPGNTYYADSRTAAFGGGAGGSTGSPLHDDLSPVTAALYTKYLSINDTTDDTGSKYQLAIWKVEQEIKWVNNKWVQYTSGAQIHGDYQQSKFNDTVIQGLIDNVGTPTSIGNVRVMTLWTGYDATNGTFSGNAQDQLVYGVPIPAAFLLGLLGLGAAGLKLRKFA